MNETSENRRERDKLRRSKGKMHLLRVSIKVDKPLLDDVVVKI